MGRRGPIDRYAGAAGRDKVRRERDESRGVDSTAARLEVAKYHREQQLDKASFIIASTAARYETIAWARVVHEWLSEDRPRRFLVGGIARSLSILAEQCRLATAPRSIPQVDRLRYVRAEQLRNYLFDMDGKRQKARDERRAPWMSDRSLLPMAPPGRKPSAA
jgi:hypothetical protein